MGLKKIISAFVVMIGIATPAFAETMVKASDPEGIVKVLNGEGFNTELGIDSYGDPIIYVEYRRLDFTLEFYGCDNGKNCTSIMIFADYPGYSRRAANDWNTERRWTRTYTDGDSSRLELDFYTGRTGLGQSDFVDLIEIWVDAQTDFDDMVG